MFLQEILTEVKVTAVKWIKEGDLLLAGTGGNLKAYKGKEKVKGIRERGSMGMGCVLIELLSVP